MSISLFELFSIGIGPSSSHTVGPMRAANAFVNYLSNNNLLTKTTRIQIDLYGSLALTGKGHGTDKAILNGLEGKTAEGVDPESMIPRMQQIIAKKRLHLNAQHEIVFDNEHDFLIHQKEFLPKHSNGLRLSAFDTDHKRLHHQVYYSIGGGFIVTEENYGLENTAKQTQPYPFSTAIQLLDHCRAQQQPIHWIMLENEKTWRSESDIRAKIFEIADIMSACIEKGANTKGILPGGLAVKRRAAEINEKLQQNKGITSIYEDADIMNRLNMYAMAVNEENAAGGRVVTAPTNGASGIIPAVMEYYKNFHKEANKEGIVIYFLTAAAIGILYKKGASISGAEVGCQGEVGVASSMAAAGLTAALSGTIEQIENAAEIAMEHHLGMTCDPIDGLVQIPCIERNAMGAVKAVNAARMALLGDGQNKVPLDKVIKTMKQTGHDMMTIYKETSLGGLAVNLPEC